MAKRDQDSLDQDLTRMGSVGDAEPEAEQSLGDQSTFGDAGSSLSALTDTTDSLVDDTEIVDLSKRYEIEGVLGKGGMGEVLRARDKRLKRPVAIKRIKGQLAQSQQALARFLTEAQAVAALNHYHIVQIFDYGRDAEGPFLIMELVEGQSLEQRLKEGPLELSEAVEITSRLCDALSFAHEQGIIHRDIKPANILLNPRDEPKLTDFGLARQDTADHGQTVAGAVLGTIDFMPPEQRRDATFATRRAMLQLAYRCFAKAHTVRGTEEADVEFLESPMPLPQDPPGWRYKAGGAGVGAALRRDPCRRNAGGSPSRGAERTISVTPSQEGYTIHPPP